MCDIKKNGSKGQDAVQICYRINNVGDDDHHKTEHLPHLRGHLLSVSVPKASRMHGVEVGELRLPKGAAVTLVVRDGASFVPAPTTVLRRGDELLV
ncbi:TrkA C-terminal domain-containing protein, partial [Bacillus velezensis]